MREVDLFNIIYDVFSAEGGEIPCMVLAASENMFHPTSAFQRPRPIDREIERRRRPAAGARRARRPRLRGADGQADRLRRRRRPTTKTMFDVCLEAYHAIVAELKPGCTAADLRRAGQVITDRGYTVVAPLCARCLQPARCGPFVGTSHRPDKDVTLAPGMGAVRRDPPVQRGRDQGGLPRRHLRHHRDGARWVNHLEPKVYEL